MKRVAVFSLVAAWLLTGAGCEVIDPLVMAFGLPLEVSEDVNGGNSWDETETFDIESEIEELDVSYLADVTASRVNDITIFIKNPPSSGTSSGILMYSLGGSPILVELARWSNVPFSAMAEPGVSILDAAVLTVDPVQRAAILSALQDSTGLPVITSVTFNTSGTTSVNVPAGTVIVARLQYQVDVEL